MRSLIPFLVLLALTGGAAAGPADPRALELAWHRCLREAIAHQPIGQSPAGNERNALDECKEREDAYVAALMSARPQSMWAWAWTSITEPLSSWVSVLRH